MTLVFAAALIIAQSTQATPPPPTPTASPAITAGGDFTLYAFHTDRSNATGALDTPAGADLPDRADLSNLLLNVNATAGKLHANVTVGQYGFPTVGQALNPDAQSGANMSLYSGVPVAALTYAFDSHWSLAAGKFAALLGQESPFTYQNLNVERGLAWAMEPTISRGVQVAYANAPWTVTVQENDAYYSGHDRAFEGLIAWAPSASTAVQFATIVPGANAGPNPTTAVGNKAEYDLMYTRQIGKLLLVPYFLWVHSPASAIQGFTRDERANAAVFMGSWTFSPQWLVAFRYESVRNGSVAGDTSPNADLVGYGVGSGAQTVTVTPAYHFGYSGVLRLEFSRVTLSSFTAGAGFGAAGTDSTQNRLGFELGVMH